MPSQKDKTLYAEPPACFVCMDATADAVLIECGHGGLCAGALPPCSPLIPSAAALISRVTSLTLTTPVHFPSRDTLLGQW